MTEVGDEVERDVETEFLFDRVRGGIDSLTWLLNNAHNHDSPKWQEFEASARKDRHAALVALSALLANDASLRRTISEKDEELARKRGLVEALYTQMASTGKADGEPLRALLADHVSAALSPETPERCPTCGREREAAVVEWDYNDPTVEAVVRAREECPDSFHTQQSKSPEP